MSDKIKQKTVLIIGGPTASGKSGLGFAVAEKFGGVVINCDSMQVYTGLPILTAQPSREKLAEVPHKLYSVLAPEEVCSAVKWRNLALTEIKKANNSEKFPIIVGGNGFYLKALMEGLSPIPDIPEELRMELSQKQKEIGTPEFYQEFSKVDPVMAKKLDQYNSQRIIRAWEVLEFTGKSLSEWQKEPLIKPPADLSFRSIVIVPERETLYEACNLRFKEMLALGALDEVENFRLSYKDDNVLSKALGYKELCCYLEDKTSLEDAITASQKSTRNYAKRQITWFKNQIKADLLVDNPKKSITNVMPWIKQECFDL